MGIEIGLLRGEKLKTNNLQIVYDWATKYVVETEDLINKLKYHNLMHDEISKAEGRIQAYNELKKFLLHQTVEIGFET